MSNLDYGICMYFLFFYSFNVRFCLKADGKGALPTKLSKCSVEKLYYFNDAAYTALKKCFRTFE